MALWRRFLLALESLLGPLGLGLLLGRKGRAARWFAGRSRAFFYFPQNGARNCDPHGPTEQFAPLSGLAGGGVSRLYAKVPGRADDMNAT
ncbi:hypothetical protein LMG27198_23160 [Methylocystis echinoides]|uniref:Uncharacterized protein n=1 Tax=Methylocystis echinoides TaxID=29468 RepID=A0A9W6LSH5_9HYPH|nr:hypothetical protein LMG27198_23160 [Methylocystis echinoides]